MVQGCQASAASKSFVACTRAESAQKNKSDLETLHKDDTIRLRKRHLGESCKLMYRSNPLKIVRGKGQFLFDENGEAFLDCINNVAHVGHCNESVVRAVEGQLRLLNTNNRYLHDSIVILAERLAATLPAPLSVCYVVNSGSEANDLALRLARAHTKGHHVVCLEDAYHGHLSSLIDISPYKFKKGSFPKPDWVHVAELPDMYRGKWRKDELGMEEAGQRYGEDAADLIGSLPAGHLAAFIAESAPSCAGQIILPPGYLRRVYQAVRDAGGICIADEVQIGFGRSGYHYWGFQLQGPDVVPDIITIGKSMGNGFPVAAVVTSEKISRSLAETGMEYFNTYGGNAASCAAALAVMDVVKHEKLMENATAVGACLIEGLRSLAERHEPIGDVRGAGLFLGIDLVIDRTSRRPATALAEHLITRFREEGLLVSTDGPYRNVLKIKPPMVFSETDAKRFLSVLDKLLSDTPLNRSNSA